MLPMSRLLPELLDARRHDGADAEQHGDDRGGLRVGKLLAHLRQVAADDVSGLVREDADNLIGRGRLLQRAGS